MAARADGRGARVAWLSVLGAMQERDGASWRRGASRSLEPLYVWSPQLQWWMGCPHALVESRVVRVSE